MKSPKEPSKETPRYETNLTWATIFISVFFIFFGAWFLYPSAFSFGYSFPIVYTVVFSYLYCCLYIFFKYSKNIFTAILGVTLAFSTVLIYSERQSSIAEWKEATIHIVKQYNQTSGEARPKINVEEMTPRKLSQITNPCTVWDWRERNKKCNK